MVALRSTITASLKESDARAVMKAIQTMAAQLTTIDGNTDLIL